MLQFMHYAKGKQALGEGDYPKPKNDELLMVLATAPSSDEIVKASKDFHIPQKALESFARSQHPKRFSLDPLSFVLIDYFLEREEIKHTRLLFHLEKNTLFIAIPEKSEYFEGLFKQIAKNFMGREAERTILYLFYDFIDSDTRDTYDVLTKTEEKIIKIEEALLAEQKVNMHELAKLKRFLYKMARRLWSNAKLIFLIKKGLGPVRMTQESAGMFDDVYDTFMHQIDIVTSQKQMLSDALQIYATNLSNNLAKQSNELNQIMKKLTALTVIIMIPSLIAGVYGMNFDNIPELHVSYGYFVALAAMLVSAIASFILFKKYKYI